MKETTLERVRDLEDRLKYANPKESARLTKELVRLKNYLLEK